jgi:hypothetical protein
MYQPNQFFNKNPIEESNILKALNKSSGHPMCLLLKIKPSENTEFARFCTETSPTFDKLSDHPAPLHDGEESMSKQKKYHVRMYECHKFLLKSL